MTFNCPNCRAELKITVEPKNKPAGPARRTATDITPLTDKMLADVWNFMKDREGRFTSSDLYNTYLRWTEVARPLSQNAFGRALKANGATQWRSAKSRGFVIPPMAEKEPAKMTDEQRERFEAAHQRQAVQDHRGGGPTGFAPTDLPLEVDGL